MEQVLVLNANFEPIHVCEMRRAVGLILTEKAALVVNGRGVIHTSSATFPKPSVIRLQAMVHAPRPCVRLTRREVFRRDQFTCQYCGKHTQELTIDHVIPRHMGGLHTWENVAAACPACNHHKGGRKLEEAKMHLLRIPKEPPHSAYYLFSHFLTENSDWEVFLQGW
mgnify:CR=1 FL=1